MRLSGFGLARQRRARWPESRAVRFITSFNDTFYEASGKRAVETFRELNPSYELWAYIEADDAEACRAMEVGLEAVGVKSIRLDSLPLLGDFLEVARDVIPKSLGGDMDDALFPGEGPQTGDIFFRKHMFRWFRKIVALNHAIRDFTSVLFWMDSDCYSKEPLPLPIIERAFRGAGVIHMKGRYRPYSETGVVGYDLEVPGVRQMIEDMRTHYMSREFIDYPRWDDGPTLDFHLERRDAPPSRDLVPWYVRRPSDVLPATVLGPYLEHEKGLHSRKLGLVT